MVKTQTLTNSMAIFERSYTKIECLDHTTPLTCTFVNSRIIDGHTEYIIRVHRAVKEDHYWTIIKRYKEFASLDRELQAWTYGINLPPKKYIGNLNRQFIAERQTLLQKYMDDILNNLVLASSWVLKKFLDPENYSIPFETCGVQNASMALRDKPDFYNIKSLTNIGWRYRKQYCSGKKRSNAEDQYILSWIEYGPDKCLQNRELQTAFKVLLNLEHLYIMPILAGGCYESGALTVRLSCSKGSLRDIIYNKSPYEPFLKKCCYMKERLMLPLNEVTTIAIQVLHALRYLHEKEIPYGSLHSGNIFIEDNVAKISDIENGLLGLPSFYRPYFINLRRIHTVNDMDVYCFGHVLYEMTFGERLQHYVCDEIPSDCYSTIKPVLELILLSSASKERLPSVSSLLSHPSFYHCSKSVIYETRPRCKMSTNTKEFVRRVKLKVEKRLHEDQRKVKVRQKLTEIQQIIDSEENVPDQNSHRKKCKVKKSTSQMSLGTTSITESVSSISTPTSNIDIPSASLQSSDEKNIKIELERSQSEVDAASPVKIQSENEDTHSALLQSIVNFNKNNLKKAKSNND